MSSNAHPVLAAFKAAFPVSTPVLAGYLFLGAGYGVLMSRLGYGPFWTAALSILIFGGTIQYIAVTLLAADFQPLNAFVISFMVNARHLFYGFSMLEKYSGMGWKKPFLVFWLTDETFSLVCSNDAPPGVDASWYRFFISSLDYLYWIVGGVVGNVAGLSFAFNSKGIEFVMTSLFTVIVVGQWRGARTHAPATIGLLITAVCLAAFGPENFLIPSMIAIVAALMLSRSRLDGLVRREEEEEACQ